MSVSNMAMSDPEMVVSDPDMMMSRSDMIMSGPGMLADFGDHLFQLHLKLLRGAIAGQCRLVLEHGSFLCMS